jgi:hypothetical protein
MAVVWAAALFVIDRRFAPQPHGIPVWPATRAERRPVLFVVHVVPPVTEGSNPVGSALPIAIIEPNGVLTAPLANATTPQERVAAAARFLDSYGAPGTVLKLLRGGADAGTLRLFDSVEPGSALPLLPGSCEGLNVPETIAPQEFLVLAVSDLRFGAATSGSRPMRAVDRTAADVAARRYMAEEYPSVTIEDLGRATVSAVDLNRDGRAETVASRTVRFRDGSGRRALSLLQIVEPGTQQSERVISYSISFVLPDNATAESGYWFVDQVDASPNEFDEVVISASLPDRRAFLVVRREPKGWQDVYRLTIGP